MKDRKWYAVQVSRTDAWDYGSYSLAKALDMLEEQGEGLIAVIENNVCIEEITYREVFGS